MTWSKFDDRYDDNRKVKKAWRLEPATVGIHAMAITYSSRHETDGWIDLDWLIEKLPNPKVRERTIKTLIDEGLLETPDGERFQVHDYLKFNPSARDLADKRHKDAERKRIAAEKRAAEAADSARNNQTPPAGIQPDSNGIPNGFHAESERNLSGIRGES